MSHRRAPNSGCPKQGSEGRRVLVFRSDAHCACEFAPPHHHNSRGVKYRTEDVKPHSSAHHPRNRRSSEVVVLAILASGAIPGANEGSLTRWGRGAGVHASGPALPRSHSGFAPPSDEWRPRCPPSFTGTSPALELPSRRLQVWLHGSVLSSAIEVDCCGPKGHTRHSDHVGVVAHGGGEEKLASFRRRCRLCPYRIRMGPVPGCRWPCDVLHILPRSALWTVNCRRSAVNWL
jgi:hypothetical protein